MGLFTLRARRVLPESPRWLARQGRSEEARAVSEQIAAGTRHFGAGSFGGDADRSRCQSFVRQIKYLARHYPGRLALGSALDFFEAFGYYGLFALLPLVVLPVLHISDSETPWFFIVGNVGAAVGGLLAAGGLDALGRKQPSLASTR